MHTYSPLTLDQFYKLLAALKGSDKVSKLEVDGFVGSATVEGIVDLTWTYKADSFSVDVTIVAKHGAAHFASDAKIYDEINKQFVIPVRE